MSSRRDLTLSGEERDRRAFAQSVASIGLMVDRIRQADGLTPLGPFAVSTLAQSILGPRSITDPNLTPHQRLRLLSALLSFWGAKTTSDLDRTLKELKTP